MQPSSPAAEAAGVRGFARTGLVLVVALVAALGPAAPPSVAVVGDCNVDPSWGTPRGDLAARVIQLVNEHRAKLGLITLTGTPVLSRTATWKARHMAKYTYMTHNDPAPPVARTPRQRFEACGFPMTTSSWGENIAYGY